ncbi:MAG: ankyrin repeat domain-containing protein [Thermoguttaceae bacterium]|jgi:ankyrin repeat protein
MGVCESAARDNIENVLLRAAEVGTPKDVQIVLSSGAKVDCTDGRGFTPLMLAAARGNLEIVHILINGGANVSARNSNNICAILLASHRGNTEVIKALIDAGADIHSRNSFGYSPLVAASEGKHIAAVRLLLQRGARVDVGTDGVGASALACAVKSKSAEIVKELLAAGADPNSRDQFGRSVIDSASSLGLSEIAVLLRSKGAVALDIHDDDRDALRVFWRCQGREWWCKQSATEAHCDYCNGPVPRDHGYLIGTRLSCDHCLLARILTEDNFQKLKQDPHYFGAGMVSAARRHMRNYGST